MCTAGANAQVRSMKSRDYKAAITAATAKTAASQPRLETYTDADGSITSTEEFAKDGTYRMTVGAWSRTYDGNGQLRKPSVYIILGVGGKYYNRQDDGPWGCADPPQEWSFGREQHRRYSVQKRTAGGVSQTVYKLTFYFKSKRYHADTIVDTQGRIYQVRKMNGAHKTYDYDAVVTPFAAPDVPCSLPAK